MVPLGVAGRNPKKRRRRLAALGKYILGYETTAEPGTKRYGPQPWEALVSEICDAFTTTPDVAERLLQDRYDLVTGILDYRNLRGALRIMNDTTDPMERAKALGAHPELGQLIKEIQDAQDAGD